MNNRIKQVEPVEECQCGCVRRKARLQAALSFDCGFDSAAHKSKWRIVMDELMAEQETGLVSRRLETENRIAKIEQEALALLHERGSRGASITMVEVRCKTYQSRARKVLEGLRDIGLVTKGSSPKAPYVIVRK